MSTSNDITFFLITSHFKFIYIEMEIEKIFCNGQTCQIRYKQISISDMHNLSVPDNLLVVLTLTFFEKY